MRSPIESSEKFADEDLSPQALNKRTIILSSSFFYFAKCNVNRVQSEVSPK